MIRRKMKKQERSSTMTSYKRYKQCSLNKESDERRYTVKKVVRAEQYYDKCLLLWRHCIMSKSNIQRNKLVKSLRKAQ